MPTRDEVMCCIAVRRKSRRKICILIFYLTFLLLIFGWTSLRQKFSETTTLKSWELHQPTHYINSKGVHIVIGHYLGGGNDDEMLSNRTDEFADINMYDPKPNEGKNGRPVIIPSFLAVKARQLFHINRFNLLASDRIPLNRTLPDVRKKRCLKNAYNLSVQHSVSVIIVFYNEAWSTLLRTVISVINRSPKHLLHEIILVDDASTRSFLKSSLDEYVSKLSVHTYVIHSETRKGLIQSRLLGAQKAEANILVFLDAHCECTTGWLESLVHYVSLNRSTVACPVIDIINDETFAYVRSFERHFGAFNWDLHFRWYTMQPSNDDPVKPFKTPVMAGGLFAINKEYFFEIGAYDDKMAIWGGENLELSFRIWQCGGSIYIVPCSHVGHVFRKSSPYVFPGGVSKVLYSNLIRVALVWMDEWDANDLREKQNVQQRLQLRKKLSCRNFAWYLRNIWIQRFMPMEDRFFGKIHHIATGMCLEKPAEKTFLNQPTGVAGISKCTSRSDLFQLFVLANFKSVDDNSFSIATDESICLHATDDDSVFVQQSKIQFMACIDSSKQRWIYDSTNLRIRHYSTNLCMSVHRLERTLILSNCSNNNYQEWKLESVQWKR